MTRRLLNPLTVLSLLLCVALWVRSDRLHETIGYVRAGTRDHWGTLGRMKRE